MRATLLALIFLGPCLLCGCKRDRGQGASAVGSVAPLPGSTEAPVGSSGQWRVHKTFSYDFKTDLGLEPLLSKLQSSGPWEWTRRSSELKGDYISTRVMPEEAMVKLYRDVDHAHVDVRCQSDRPAAEDECEQVRHVLIEKVLPSVGAREIATSSSYD